MALIVKDRVKQQTTTTGTGTYTLSGSFDSFQTFAEIGDGNTTYYCCTDGTDFEIGIGTYTASGTTLARTTILQSSNSDAAVNWTSGTRTIFCTQPADKAVFFDADGAISIPDGSSTSNYLGIGNSDEFKIYHDGNQTVISNVNGSGPIKLQGKFGEQSIIANQDGAVELYNNNTKRFETSSGGSTVTGALTLNSSNYARIEHARDGTDIWSTGLRTDDDYHIYRESGAGNVVLSAGNLELGDDQELRIGDGTDLKIWHQSSSNNSFIQETGGGSLKITGEEVQILNAANTEYKAKFKDNGAVELYYDGYKTFATTSEGVDVYNNDATNTDGPVVNLRRDSASPAVNDILGDVRFLGRNDAAEYVGYAGIDGIIYDETDGTENGALRISALNNGTNTTYLTFGDGRARFSQDARFDDNVKAKFGTGGDLEVFHNGSSSVINDVGTGKLTIGANDRIDLMNPGATEYMARFIQDGAVELYYDNTKRLETTSTGVIIPGNLYITDNASGYGQLELTGATGAYIDLKSPSTDDYDLRFITDGTTSKIQSDDLQLLSKTDAEFYIDATLNGAVNLYYDNVKKLETTADGISVLSTADNGPVIKLVSDDPADAAGFGVEASIKFFAENDASESFEYANIFLSTAGVADGNESGWIYFKTAASGTLGNTAAFSGDSLVLLKDSSNITFNQWGGTSHNVVLKPTTPSAARTITLPDATGEVVLKDSSDVVTISSTANNGPVLKLVSDDHADSSDYSREARITFTADNTANQATDYASISLITEDVTDSTENGRITFQNIKNGTEQTSHTFGSNVLILHDDGHFITWQQTRGTNFNVNLYSPTPTATRDIFLPDGSGTLALRNGNAVLLNTTTVSSGVSSVDFGSSLITDDYDNYLLVVEDLTVSAATGIRLRLGTANSADGSSIYNHNAQWRGRALTSTTNNTQSFSSGSAGSASAIIMGGNNQDVGTAATESANFKLHLQNLRSTTFHKTISGVTGSCFLTDISGTNSGVTYVCSLRDLQFCYQNTAAVNFLTIYEEDAASQISGGTFSLYGLKT